MSADSQRGSPGESGRNQRHGATSRLLSACLDILRVDGAAITLLAPDGDRELVNSTDWVSRHLDELQFIVGEGPCLDAFHSQEPVLISDVAGREARERWPGFAPMAEEVGARAVFAMPLVAGDFGFGVLEVYRSRPGNPTHDEQAAARMIGERAVHVVLTEMTDDLRSRDPWQAPAESDHADVQRAAGMIAAQMSIPIRDAMSRLRATAFAEKKSIGAVAREVLGRIRSFNEQMP